MQGSEHQNDHVLLDPLLVSLLKNGSLPFFNQAKLYMLNAWVVLRFLHRSGCITTDGDVGDVNRSKSAKLSVIATQLAALKPFIE